MTFQRTLENFKNAEETVEVTTVAGKVFTGKIILVDGVRGEGLIIMNDVNGVVAVNLQHVVSVQKVVRTPTMYKKPVGRPAQTKLLTK